MSWAHAWRMTAPDYRLTPEEAARLAARLGRWELERRLKEAQEWATVEGRLKTRQTAARMWAGKAARLAQALEAIPEG